MGVFFFVVLNVAFNLQVNLGEVKERKSKNSPFVVMSSFTVTWDKTGSGVKVRADMFGNQPRCVLWQFLLLCSAMTLTLVAQLMTGNLSIVSMSSSLSVPGANLLSSFAWLMGRELFHISEEDSEENRTLRSISCGTCNLLSFTPGTTTNRSFQPAQKPSATLCCITGLDTNRET